MNQTCISQPQLDAYIRICSLLASHGITSSLFWNGDNISNTQAMHSACPLWNDCCQCVESSGKISYQDSDKTILVDNNVCPTSHPVAVINLEDNLHIKICTRMIQNTIDSNSAPTSPLLTETDIENSFNNYVSSIKNGEITLSIIEKLLSEHGNIIKQLDQNRHEKDLLADALERSFEEINLLHKIGDIVCLNQKPAEYIGKVARDLLEVIECGNIVVYWQKIDTQSDNKDIMPSVYQEGCHHLSEQTIDTIWQIASIVSSSGKSFTIENDFHSSTLNLPDKVNNFIVTPIISKEGNIGALAAINKSAGTIGFSTVEARMLQSIANRLSNSHETQTLHLRQQELMMGTLRALVRSIDAKDPYTCGHSERVARISKFLAEQMQLTEEEIENTYMAGLLHDIGKIGIRGSTLRKDARLTDDEFEEIKKHPQIGAGILKGIKQISIVVNGVLTHHERYDGKGYPFGLSGNNIPVIGRIVNIADTFDAMISSRPYRRSLPISKVLHEISRFSGTQFDPEIAEIMLRSDIAPLLKLLNSTENTTWNDSWQNELYPEHKTTKVDTPKLMKQLSIVNDRYFNNCGI